MEKRAGFRRWVVVAAPALVLALGARAGQAAGPFPAASPDQSEPQRSQSIRAAVVLALPLLVKASADVYPKHRDCFSCHNQGVPAVALALARRQGFAVDAEALRKIAEHTEADLNAALGDYRKGRGQPGGVIRAGYALWALEATGWAPDETTAAVVHYLAVVPGQRDHWMGQANRPPSEFSDFTATALALRSFSAFGTAVPEAPLDDHNRKGAADRADVNPASTWRSRALRWLNQARPRDTEERVFRLWALKYAGASSQDLAAAANDLLRTQRPDGGWSQLEDPPAASKAKDEIGPRSRPTAQSSDAYATGSALVALALAGGVAAEQPAYRRGVDFLVRSQRDDGSWFVKSRSKPFQNYFESGFPHGPDQFISAAATGWAVAALALACPSP
jgi:hypothetical protein